MRYFVINNWISEYEVNKDGRPAKAGDELRTTPLDYLRLKTTGKALTAEYRRLLETAGKEKAMMIYGYYVKFATLAGAEVSENRGGVIRNERHEEASEEDIAFLLDLPIKQIRYAIGVLANLGWIEIKEKEEAVIQRESLNSASVAEISDASDRKEIVSNNLNTIVSAAENCRKQVQSSFTNTKQFTIPISNTNSINIQSLHFHDTLISIIRPRDQSDCTCFRHITQWLKQKCDQQEFDNEIFKQVLQFAAESVNARRPAAAFVSALKKNLGYDPKRLPAPTGLRHGGPAVSNDERPMPP